MNEDLDFLDPFFLGPAAENAELLEELIVEFLRDHVYWRRNFHPEDGQRIASSARTRPDYVEFQARLRTELYALSAELKQALPSFHPRYVGHMSSDLLIAGLVARIVTTLYNPNNVAEETAPVTLDMELEVGEQLARMIGYRVDENREPCAWGHLTSGGTVANYEALWNLRSVKFYGIALQAGAAACGFDPDGVGPAHKSLSTYSDWELLNLSVDSTIELRRTVGRQARTLMNRRDLHDFVHSVRGQRLEALGTAGFFLQHPDVSPPKVMVSASGHYSWDKAMKVLGLGTSNLCKIQVESHMRMDAPDLRRCLDEAFESHTPVLAVVGILGSTEFGTFDPIHEVIAARDSWRQRGLDFGVHVDAAWGGYLTSVFRRPDGSFADREELRRSFRYFPSERIYRAFKVLPQADSITVDPHKLGYVPYAAGAFIARNREVVDFVSEAPAYVFDSGGSEGEASRRDQLHNLGQYILEGSKAGAAAASVYVTHKVLPLHSEGFGRILSVTVRASEAFWDSARQATERLAERVQLSVPFEPDSNLACLAMNPSGNRCLAVMNRFGRQVFRRMRVDTEQPLQVKTFIGSYTSLKKKSLPGAQAHRILEELGIDPVSFVRVPEDDEREADHIFILRHTLMNPWLLTGPRGHSYIDEYWSYLESVIDEVLNEDTWRSATRP